MKAFQRAFHREELIGVMTMRYNYEESIESPTRGRSIDWMHLRIGSFEDRWWYMGLCGLNDIARGWPMESISFTEFAKTPKPFVTCGLSQGGFIHDLFIRISKLEGSENSFSNKADSTLPQYYSSGMFEVYNGLEKQVSVAIDKVGKYTESEEVLE